MRFRLAIVVPTPAHSSVAGPLSYSSELPLSPGTLVRVPLGRREVAGVVWDCAPDDDATPGLKPVSGVLEGVPPLGENWRKLITFCCTYYRRGVGEVAVAALPPHRRALDPGPV